MKEPPDAAAYDPDLYRLLIERVRDYAIFALDATGHIRTWNPAAQRMKGYSADEIIGRHFSVFYPEEDLAWDKPGYELKEAARVGRFEDEGWRLRKDGSRFWANVVITALTDSEGKLVGFGKVTRDLTERRRREEQERELAAESAARMAAEQRRAEVEQLNTRLEQQALELEQQIEEAQQLTEELEMSNVQLQEATEAAERSQREAMAANAAKSKFLAAMSHELRTPLNAIAGYLQLIELGVHGPVTEAQHKALNRARHSQQHLLALINDVLNFAKLEAGRVEYHLEDLRLDEVISQMMPMIEPQLAAKGIARAAHVAPGTMVRADRDKLQQILLNLLSNAAKFTDAGGRVTVQTATCNDTSSDCVCLEVTDTGCGIPAGKLEEIFDPFVQAHRQLTRVTEGAGLGLAISRDLARGMGGDILVRSIEGRGATFTLVLPEATRSEQQPRTEADHAM
ncbi:MAG TPA: PAS domain-containing sensor histidine kinase [Gemmatimonadaceae bacterium]|nr:PAS domain-containing sensor histidine kinase [Gemmatimonadaceae bacterium]